MNSRDRTFRALKYKPTDRIPIDFWATDSVVQNLETVHGKSYTEVLDEYDVDLRYIEGPAYVGPPLAPGTDIWGVERTSVAVGSSGQAESYNEVLKAPLSDAETQADIDAYCHWPDPEMFDFSVVERQCDAIRDQGRVVVFMGDRLNRVAQLKPAMYIRGTEQIFVDLAMRPEMVEALFNRIRKFYLVYLERILRAAKGKIDIVLTGDDFGAQHGLLISSDMWRRFVRPGFSEYIDLIKTRDVLAMHHTCGSVVDIIPDMIECGLDILQSVQPEAGGMAAIDLKRRFGKSICYQGGVSIQKTMPFGSPADVRGEVAALAEVFKPEGGYIFCTSHNIQADTPVENIHALMEAYLEYGRY